MPPKGTFHEFPRHLRRPTPQAPIETQKRETMKKQVILTLILLTGGLALPATAQCRSQHPVRAEVFISGYLPCGDPIYAKRVYHGRYVRVVPLTGYELRHYLERQRRIAAQRAYERRLIRERAHRGYGHGRGHGYHGSRYQPTGRRCR